MLFRSGVAHLDVKHGPDSFSIFVDLKTGLLRRVLTMIDDPVLGNASLCTWFDDYVPTDGLQLPRRLTTTVDAFNAKTIDVARYRINAALGEIGAPAQVRTAAIAPPSAPVTAEEVSAGVWILGGGSYSSVLLEFSDHLVLIEAPLNGSRTAGLLAKIMELRPNKPLRFLVHTSRYFESTGGVRAAIAAGLTVVSQQDNRTFLEKLVAAEHSLAPDALTLHPAPLRWEAVADRKRLGDAAKPLELLHVQRDQLPNGLLAAYLPRERILIRSGNVGVPGDLPVGRIIDLNTSSGTLRTSGF